ncbi:folylpolyglutamate synthase [Physocladia obscura]|uniref:Dihydrofolate synthetase n=1 Tax=Physocladia obscura TaxID=109957 RepID=A0AAD5XFW6_9FUNG|nr:folylpolyglutamate synthase [Physocladia obscura]
MGEIRLGLGRITRLLAALGSPHEKLKAVIHVAGTNGKGSTCAFVGQMLTAAGLTTGRFSSPHFLHVTDAVCIDSVPIAEKDYTELSERIESTLRDYNPASNNSDADVDDYPTSFERECALALLYFAARNVDVAIIEVGLGGRLDATNVFKDALCVITPIAIDHKEFLGNSIGEIANQKAGIIHKTTSHCILAAQPFAETQRVIVDRINSLDSHTHLHHVVRHVSPIFTIDAGSHGESDGWVRASIFDATFDVRMPLLGEFQLENLATALCAITVFFTEYRPNLPKPSIDAIRCGITSTRWPGRLEILTPFPASHPSLSILADGAHNEHGAQSLRKYIDSSITLPPTVRTKVKILWIIGMKNDFDKIDKLVPTLIRHGDTVWTVGFESPVGMPWITAANGANIRQAVETHFPPDRATVDVVDVGTVGEALEKLKIEWSRIEKGNELLPTIVCCGSLYLMASLYRCF